MKFILKCLIVCISVAGIMQGSQAQIQREDNGDSLLWKMADKFSLLFDQPDTSAMNSFLPSDFMIQWMHENFMGKKGLFRTMLDTAVHNTFKHRLVHDVSAVLLYSDDGNAACLNTSFVFLNSQTAISVKNKHGYGLCIMYFQKVEMNWVLKTVHLDLHCSLCNL